MERVDAGVREAFLRPPPPPPSYPLPRVEAEPPAGEPEASWRPAFLGSGGTLLGIHVVNVLLTLSTLGVYYFWAKTRVRRYLFSESEFAADRFAYHGTGRE